MGEETTIMGTVLSVVFQNEENGYAVLRLVTDDGELLTLVGCVPCAAPGENLTATGTFSSHPQCIRGGAIRCPPRRSSRPAGTGGRWNTRCARFCARATKRAAFRAL